MKRLLVVFAMSIMVISVASCNRDKHSRAVKDATKIVDEVITQIDQANDCEGLKAAIRGLDKLYDMENYGDLTEEDLKLLTQKSGERIALKESQLCNQEEYNEENLMGESRPFSDPEEGDSDDHFNYGHEYEDE